MGRRLYRVDVTVKLTDPDCIAPNKKVAESVVCDLVRTVASCAFQNGLYKILDIQAKEVKRRDLDRSKNYQRKEEP